MKSDFVLRTMAILLGAVLGIGSCGASELVYHPANPTFGGNPLNGSYLLSQAQAQGLGTRSGSAGPDLSGLENSLNNLGSGGGGGVVIVQPGGGSSGSGAGSSNGAASQTLFRSNRNIP
jgi:curli production assembly/transport component CsgF